MIRRTLFFSGRVQGVGFRYTAQRVAQGFDVSGYVRNLPDGRVEAVIEGEDQEVEDCVQAVAKAMARNIQNMRSALSEPTGEFDGFDIRF